jgi:hypothetical protein
MLGIRISMFLGIPDLDPLVNGKELDPLVRGTDPDPSFSHKGVEQTEIMLAK